MRVIAVFVFCAYVCDVCEDCAMLYGALLEFCLCLWFMCMCVLCD